MTTETQPYDDCYAAFLIGGNICLAAALAVALIQVFALAGTSVDGSGIALLLMLLGGGYLLNKGFESRYRLRNNARV